MQHTRVFNLSPLRGMQLSSLNCAVSIGVSDLPMEQMQYTDRSPLKALPLKLISLDFQAERDTELLLSIRRLKTINDKPLGEFWQVNDEKK